MVLKSELLAIKGLIPATRATREEEYALICRIIGGDKDAELELFRNCILEILQLAQKFGSTHDRIQELFSEGTLAFYENIHDFDPSRSRAVGGFVHRCARNRMINFLRRSRKEVFWDNCSIETAGSWHGCAKVPDDPEQASMIRQRRERVSSKMKKLSEEQCAMLRARHVGDRVKSGLAESSAGGTKYIRSQERTVIALLRRRLRHDIANGL